MSHELSRVKRIIQFLTHYRHPEPLHVYLKNYFRQHKEMGARDRRLFSQAIYSWFRLGKALVDVEAEKRLALAVFLMNSSSSNELNNYLVKTFLQYEPSQSDLSLTEKVNLIKQTYPLFNQEDIFPFKEHVCNDLDYPQFLNSLAVQPLTWIRVRQEFLSKFKNIVEKENVSFVKPEKLSFCFGFDSGLNIALLPGMNEFWYEVQDYSSQLTGNFFKPSRYEHWLDCCAASGGKSLLLHSLEPTIQLTVTDKRTGSLQNLRDRFKRNNIKHYGVEVVNLEEEPPKMLEQIYVDGIIADVPCSGSGTWSRSPEQLSFFKVEDIKTYTATQKKIVEQVVPFLNAGKPLLYITCSVFKAENDEMVEWIKEKFDFELEKKELIKGAEYRADTMYVARLIKK